MAVESDQEINCPYCAAAFTLRIDETGGKSQFFVTDCEICCRPIEIELSIDSDGYVNLIAKREGEG